MLMDWLLGPWFPKVWVGVAFLLVGFFLFRVVRTKDGWKFSKLWERL